MKKVTAWYCEWCGFYTQRESESETHQRECKAKERIEIEKQQIAAALAIEQNANKEVEKLAHKYEREIRQFDMMTEDADCFIDSLLSELSERIKIPYYSSWWENAKKRIWNIVYVYMVLKKKLKQTTGTEDVKGETAWKRLQLVNAEIKNGKFMITG